MVVKYFEYGAKLHAGITISTDMFLHVYFCLTGIHLMHVIAGTIILIVIWLNARARLYHTGNRRGSKQEPPTGTWWTCYGSFCSRCSTCCGDQ